MDAKLTRTKILLVLLVIAIVAILFFTRGKMGEHEVYKCDVKNLRLSSDIIIKKDGEKVCQVKGNIFRLVEEPLTMTDPDGNKIAYAGDDYHFIAQDSHVIICDGVVTAEMVGKFDLFGETYDIYDNKGEKIAKAEFNWFDSYGTLEDTEGNLIADYESFILFNDFTLRVADNSPIGRDTVLMIFCSYYSDQAFDD